jgi:hypothetical protein
MWKSLLYNSKPTHAVINVCLPKCQLLDMSPYDYRYTPQGSFLASKYLSKQVRVVPSINTPTRVNPSLFSRQKKEPRYALQRGL